LIDAACDYQHTEDPTILAYVFVRLYPFTRTLVSNFFNLTEEDQAHCAVTELHNAMMDYSPMGGATLQTFYRRYLNRRLYAETNLLNCDVRKANYVSESYETIITPVPDDGNLLSDTSNKKISNMTCHEDAYGEIELLHTLKSTDSLSANELRYCEIIVQDGALTDSEVSRRLNVTPAAINYIKNRLRTKLGGLLLA
jgi:DNA-binding CsgD family transcriptional regulator